MLNLKIYGVLFDTIEAASIQMKLHCALKLRVDQSQIPELMGRG